MILSRGFAFVRCKYHDDAEMAVDRLDGRVVDRRELAVQFAKYGLNAQQMIVEKVSKHHGGSSSRSPPRSYREDYYGNTDYRRGSRSSSLDRYERDKYPQKGASS